MNQVIKIYLTGSFAYTPFTGFHEMDIPFLNAHHIHITKNIQEADLLVAQNSKKLKPYFLKFLNRKKYLIWTLEPRFDTNATPVRSELFGLIKCHIMNVYTGDVFVSPLSFHGGLINEKLEFLSDDYEIPNKTVVGLMTRYNGLDTKAVMVNGKDVDLIKVRTQIALYGQERGMFHIYGKGWPAGISKEDSRVGQWVNRKKEILRDYQFNLCFENTAAKNYLTEKIWDSIASHCLPIYYAEGTGIYDLFPENSFIDYSRLNSPMALFNMIHNMTALEYTARLNKCIVVYNSISAKEEGFVIKEREKSLKSIVQKIGNIR